MKEGYFWQNLCMYCLFLECSNYSFRFQFCITIARPSKRTQFGMMLRDEKRRKVSSIIELRMCLLHLRTRTFKLKRKYYFVRDSFIYETSVSHTARKSSGTGP
jgi:hypothetical protein